MEKTSNTVFVPSLILALEDEHSWVRMAAVRALGRLNDQRAVPGLVRALRDEDEDIRHDAAIMLGRLQDARAVPELLRRLSDKAIYGLAYTGERVCDAVIGALGRIGDKTAVPKIEKQLKTRSILTRYSVAYALGNLGKPTSVTALVELLSDERTHFLYGEKRICDAAAEAIQKIDTSEGRKILEDWQNKTTL